MSAIIEALEFRRLLSASPDQLSADLQQLFDLRPLPTDVLSCRTTLLADFKAISGDLRALPHTAANRALVAAVRKSQNQWMSTVQREYHRLIRSDLPLGLRVGHDEMALFEDTSNTVAASQLLADLRTLEPHVSGRIAAFLADVPRVTSSLTGALAAVASANPSSATLQAQVTSETLDVSDCAATLQSDVSTGQADVATMISDLSM